MEGTKYQILEEPATSAINNNSYKKRKLKMTFYSNRL